MNNQTNQPEENLPKFSAQNTAHVAALHLYAYRLMSYELYSSIDLNQFYHESDPVVSLDFILPCFRPGGNPHIFGKPVSWFDPSDAVHCNALFQFSLSLITFEPSKPLETKHQLAGRTLTRPEIEQMQSDGLYAPHTKYWPIRFWQELRIPNLTQFDCDRIPVLRGIRL